MPPLDTPNVLNLVQVTTHHAGPQGILPGDTLWVDPTASYRVRCYATRRGYVAAEQPPFDAYETLGGVLCREWKLQP
jgi:hypothetical protein